MTTSLIIKDGAGTQRNLAVESSSFGYVPVHSVSSSVANPVYVSGALSVAPAIVTTVSQSFVTSFSWTGSASGTFALTESNVNRKGLTIFNPGPYSCYMVLSTTSGTTNGFTLTNTASAPSFYSFILFPSGTFMADSTNVSINYGGYFISGAASTGVFVSATH